MTTQQIHERLDTMLTNPKTKNFINHLVRSYLPISNVEKVWEKPKVDFKCVITNDGLSSIQDIREEIQSEQFKKDFIDNLKEIFTHNANTISPIVKLVSEKKLGVTGMNTTTFMSYDTFNEFYNWVITKELQNDKHINWLLRSIKTKSVVKTKTNLGTPKTNIQNNQTSRATYTLGETDTFKKLKQKLIND